MKHRLAAVALECLFDLGITVVYAVLVGIAIVAIVASDDGFVAVLRTGLYVTVLPVGALLLIGSEIVWRLASEKRSDEHSARRALWRRMDQRDERLR